MHPLVDIGPARADDVPAVVRLLAEANLPTDGLEPHLDTTVVARKGATVVACAALELYESDAMLRSVAVSPELRSTGLGARITQAMVDLARERGIAALYLLTETADGYFARHGFEPVERTRVPARVKASIEFTKLCPESAVAMRRVL